MNLSMRHSVLECYQIYLNDDPDLWVVWVDLDLFYSKVSFGHLCFCMGEQ